MEYYWCYLDAVFTVLWRIQFSKKRYTALFSENKIIRSVVGGKVDMQILTENFILCQMAVTKNFIWQSKGEI